jgi:hypothetical protein
MFSTVKYFLKKTSSINNTFISKSLIKSTPKVTFCHHDSYKSQCDPTPRTLVRKPAPSFKGKAWWNGDFKDISSDSFKGKWLCLFFYPLDFTFVCPTEIVDFNENAEEFLKNSNNFIY